MEFLSDSVVLSRMQFALTALFHMLWPVLTTGMGIYLVIVEGLWLKTRNPDYYLHARFWSKFYVLNFGIGVATGIPMEFQFGTNWGPLSEAIGNFFGSVIGFEASWAFMLEAAFLGTMLFGWERVNPAIHYLSTIFVAVGANLSTLWILTANSWLQTPAGGEMVAGKFVVSDYFQAILNPFMVNSVLHMFFATLETSLFVIGGISAWYILQQRHQAFFARSFKIALAVAIAVAPLQIYIGHLSGEQVYHYQPTKLAAMEAQWESSPAGQPADWSLLAIPNEKDQKNDWEITIPNGLGYILEFRKNLSEPLRGLKEWKPEDRPHMVGLIYYSFRTMIAIGFFLAGLMLVSTLQWLVGNLSVENITQQRWLMGAWVFAAPLGYIAIDSGWIVRCVGRQPWTLYGEIRTVDAASRIPASNVLVSLTGFVIVYTVLFIAALYFGSRIIRRGPNLELPIPGIEISKPAVETTPGEFIPDERPVEAQQ
ncbi:cytochrome ubiquinol oxidase subunit I [Umezakia ovalisporum]|uniref:Cytochrome ubiquinol oxidase subunit I n=3 Tax=Umezakia ovalisporum TaxID=75695 RepID=A0AA43GWC6_9CYAN|nr:cytochrome ubiquinol oxidase subunit I [Umezakia ovalisporum]MBI1241761.1 cytochrome ubiquinol oxidase subunit I [Nostoc sp. RI_552]MDH6056475.1 cytochrome ubiquinol oxidase subunit I [Umezakia ovalisporum FSS-43]MDH6062901.1 cytochrome ubiquinol oxidase subunit I [Umezakia ovalisporum FSS-62]MDH6069115.1 cytochrome ubiquinol oxidase subunit I [Umezakia ovalisporum APH033B]MDH6072647.1 cytochrome ubiquinol oxidase subunit I [Umezakia ovalisporum CobakiLakeA]